jgi:amidase
MAVSARMTIALALTCALFTATISLAPTPQRAEAGPAAPAACPSEVDGLDLTRATIPQIREALDSGQTTTRALTEGYLARIEALNQRGPKLRAVIVTAPDALEQADAADAARAAGTAEGRLAGIPLLIKDNFDTTEFMTTAGAKAMLGPPPPRDAFVVERLREAGAIVLGKANMAEWATKISDNQPLRFSDVGGMMHNPYTNGDTSGSSGGSAVASSSGLAASTIGSETAGSVILPSYFNSAVGIKPTRGLLSRGGVIPLLPQNDTPGPIDQNVTDAAEMLGLMTGVDPRDPVTARQVGHAFTDYSQFLDPNALEGARIGVQKPTGDSLFSIPGLEEIRSNLEAAGATVVQLDDTLQVAGDNPQDFVSSFQAQFRASLNRYLRARGPTSPMESMADVVAFNRRGGREAVRFGQSLLIDAENLTPREKRLAKSRLARVKTRAREAMLAPIARHDLDAVLVSPGVSSVTNTNAGFPAVTVPAGYVDGQPFGAILTGKRWREPELISYAYAYEQATSAWRSPATINPDFAAACAG